jgi:hypothetical protein
MSCDECEIIERWKEKLGVMGSQGPAKLERKRILV